MKTLKWSLMMFLTIGLMMAPVVVEAEDKPAAVVNGTAISEASLDSETQRLVEQMARQGRVLDEKNMPQVREDVLTRMVEEELLFQASQAEDIKVPDARVTEELNGIKQRFPDEKTYQDALAGTGISEKELVGKITRGMAIEELIKEHVVQEVTVSAEETRTFYDQNAAMFQQAEQVQARHILIKVESDATEEVKTEARTKIEAIQQKAADGEDFAQLASENSEGPSRAKGGDLGYFSRGQMVKPFEDACFALQTGEISGVVETQFGFHVIKVTDRKPASVIAYESAQPQIEERLKQEKSRRKIREYVDGLRAKADIQRN
jgi:peptidyl-prolyl cis-trans isomerase C